MVEFELNSAAYRAAKLNAFQQLHVSRKLAGILPKAVPAFLLGAGKRAEVAVLLASITPFMESLAAMPADDVDFICHTALSVVNRQQPTGWTAIWNANAKALMFDDIDLPTMMQLVFRVLQDSLGPFIYGLLAKAAAESPEQAATPE